MAQSLTIAELKIKISPDLTPLREQLRRVPGEVRAEVARSVDEVIRQTDEATKRATKAQQTRVDQARQAGRDIVRAAQDEGRQVVEAARATARSADKANKESAREAVQVAQRRARDMVRLAQDEARAVVAAAQAAEKAQTKAARDAAREREEAVRKAAAAQAEAMATIAREQKLSVQSQVRALKELERMERQVLEQRMKAWAEEARAADAARRKADAAHADAARRRGDVMAGTAASVGRGMMIVGSAGLGGIVLATREAIQFEKAFTGVRKTVEGSEKDFAKLERDLRAMSLHIPKTSQELSQIAETAGQLGVRTKDIGKFTDVVAKMSVATNLSQEESATSFAQIGNIMGLTAKEYERLGSTIVDLGNNSAANERQIVEMSLRLAGAGRVAEMSTPQVLAFATALSSVGIEAEAGGTAFSRVFSEMGKSVATEDKRLRLFAAVAGMSAKDFARAYKTDAAGAVVSFVEGLGKLRKEGGNVYAVLEGLQLGEIRVRDALLRSANAGDLMRQSLERGQKAWRDNTALQKEAQRAFSSTDAQLALMRNQFKDVAIDAGSTFLPMIRDAGKHVKQFGDWYRELNKEQKETLAKWVVLGSGAAILGGKLLTLGKSIMEIRAAWAAVRTAAELAAIAQGKAATAGAGAGVASAGGGLLGRLGGAAGLTRLGVIGGLGVGAVLAGKAVADDFLKQYHQKLAEDSKGFRDQMRQDELRSIEVFRKGLQEFKGDVQKAKAFAMDALSQGGAGSVGSMDVGRYIDEFLKRQTEWARQAAAASSAAANAWKSQAKGLAREFGLSVNSEFRKDATTSTGKRSLHADDLAIDFKGDKEQMAAFFEFVRTHYAGKIRELIYSPKGAVYGNRSVTPAQMAARDRKHGSTIYRDHFTHLHLALREGVDAEEFKRMVGGAAFAAEDPEGVESIASALTAIERNTRKVPRKTPLQVQQGQFRKEMVEQIRLSEQLGAELGKLSKGYAEHDEIVARLAKTFPLLSAEQRTMLATTIKQNQAEIATMENAKKARQTWGELKQGMFGKITDLRERSGVPLETLLRPDYAAGVAQVFAKDLFATMKPELKGEALDKAYSRSLEILRESAKSVDALTGKEQARLEIAREMRAMEEDIARWRGQAGKNEETLTDEEREQLETLRRQYADEKRSNEEADERIRGLSRWANEWRDLSMRLAEQKAALATAQGTDTPSPSLRGFHPLNPFSGLGASMAAMKAASEGLKRDMSDVDNAKELLQRLQEDERSRLGGGDALPQQVARAMRSEAVPADLKGQIDAALTSKREFERREAEAAKEERTLARLREAVASSRIEFQNAAGSVNHYNEALKDLGMASKDLTPEMRDLIREASQWDSAKAQIEQVRMLMNAAEDSVQDGFRRMLQGGKVTFSGIVHGFNYMVTRMVASWAQSQISDAFQGWISQIAKGFTPIPKVDNGPGISGDPGIQHAANGGSIWAGTPVLVGERGPELILPANDGYVVPNHRLPRSNGNLTVNQTFIVTTPDDAGFRQSQGAMLEDARRGLRRR